MAISLTKGQTISLAKTTGAQLSEVRMGLGWDAVKAKGGFLGSLLGGGGGGDIDLDANALLFDAKGQMVDAVWFRQLQSRDGSVRHSGDNRTGAGAGDDETIIVSLARLPQEITTVVFSVNNYTGQDFSKVENAYCRLIN